MDYYIFYEPLTAIKLPTPANKKKPKIYVCLVHCSRLVFGEKPELQTLVATVSTPTGILITSGC